MLCQGCTGPSRAPRRPRFRTEDPASDVHRASRHSECRAATPPGFGGVQEIVVAEFAVALESVECGQSCARAARHADRSRAVEGDDRGLRQLRQSIAERDDLRLIGHLRFNRPRVQGCDRGLDLVQTGLLQAHGSIEKR